MFCNMNFVKYINYMVCSVHRMMIQTSYFQITGTDGLFGQAHV
jgi:hypothetical protein